MAVGMGSRKRTPVPTLGVPLEVSYINTQPQHSPRGLPPTLQPYDLAHPSSRHDFASTSYETSLPATRYEFASSPSPYQMSHSSSQYELPHLSSPYQLSHSSSQYELGHSPSPFELAQDEHGLSLTVLAYGSSPVTSPKADTTGQPPDPLPALSWPDRHTLMRWLPGIVQVLLANLLLVLLMATYVYHRELQNRAGEVLSLTRQLAGLQEEVLTGRREQELSLVDANWLLHKQTLAHNQMDALQERHDNLLEMVAASEAHTKELTESHRAVLERLQATEANTILVRQQLALTWRRLREMLGTGVQSLDDRVEYR